MKKILCKILGHKHRWVLSFQEVRCIRCGDLVYNIMEWQIKNHNKILKSY